MGLQNFGKGKSRDHTENLVFKIKLSKKLKNRNIELNGPYEIKSKNITIPGDPSSAAFFAALTLLNNKSYLNMRSICLNPKR